MERNTYILKNIDDHQYKYILITKDMSRLQDYISNVEDDLRVSKAKSYVLFDLLLNNNIDDRYYKCYFDGKKFVRKTLSKVQDNEIDKKIICTSSSYYLKNDYLFEEMFFTNDYKKHILKSLKLSV
ncbi:type II toxin-antitoxin system RnlB family antitoxin [Cellulophaga sp. Ld12]|uniref:type II toxin-antitoxin system RnlB family antitoxin n=1 Tax=Cellulophaga sp. Ld12 TaxID=3229535 RepID=UPI0038681356